MGKLLLLFIIVPLIEAVLLAKIGAAIGWANTILMVVATGVVGAWLFRLEGGRSWRKWRHALAHGKTPEEGVLGGVLLLLGGALLITPGVVTDCVGLILLLPPSRKALAAWLGPRLMERFSASQGEGDASVGRVIHFEMGTGGPPPEWLDPDDDWVGPRPGRPEPLRRPGEVIDADFEVKSD